jgi:hypothetical protein
MLNKSAVFFTCMIKEHVIRTQVTSHGARYLKSL